MCTVSMVSGDWQRRYPDPFTFPQHYWPNYQEAVRKARLYDIMTGQKDCQDNDKAAWEEKVRKLMERVEKLEKKNA